MSQYLSTLGYAKPLKQKDFCTHYGYETSTDKGVWVYYHVFFLFSKGHNFCDSLFISLNNKALLMGSTLKQNICPYTSKFFPFTRIPRIAMSHLLCDFTLGTQHQYDTYFGKVHWVFHEILSVLYFRCF